MSAPAKKKSIFAGWGTKIKSGAKAFGTKAGRAADKGAAYSYYYAKVHGVPAARKAYAYGKEYTKPTPHRTKAYRRRYDPYGFGLTRENWQRYGNRRRRRRY